MIRTAPKIEILLIPHQLNKCRFNQIHHPDTWTSFTVHSARQKCLVTEQCTICEKKFVLWIILTVSTWLNLQKWLSFFPGNLRWVIERIHSMTDEEDTIVWGKIVFEIKRKSRWLVWDNPVSDIWLSFSTTFGLFVEYVWLLQGNSSHKRCWRTNCVGWVFMQCGMIHFTHTMCLSKIISTRNCITYNWVNCPRKQSWHWFTID